MRPERYSHELERAVSLHSAGPTPWFHHKSYLVGRDLLGSIVSKSSMGKCALGPAGVNEVEGTILVAHIEAGCLDHSTIKASQQSSLLASCFEEVVYGAHEVGSALLFF